MNKFRLVDAYYFIRWQKKYKPMDWCILGVYKWHLNENEYQLEFCFFGFDIRLVFKRQQL